jgi:lipoprotein-releasing system permease protein
MAFDAFERTLALRYLRARRKEGFVSVIAGFSLLGIALGVATLIVVMAVMNGFRADLLDRILGLNSHVIVQGVRGPIDDAGRLVPLLEGLPHVVSAAPAVEGQVMIAAGEHAGGALVRGIEGAALARRPLVAERIVAGSLDAFRGDDAIMIGRRLAEAYGLGVGDALTLISPRGKVTAFGTVPRIRAYHVAAIFEVGMYEYDSGFLYMPLEAARVFFQMRGRATHLEVITDRPDRLAEITPRLRQALGPDYAATDWTNTNAGFFRALQVERNVMFLILAMIVLVAAFNVVSGLVMMVKDKGRDIAILRTMGAGRGAVLRIFFLAGASVGLLGTAAGVGLGLLVASNIEAIRRLIEETTGRELFSAKVYFLTTLPARVDAGDVLAVVAMAVGLSFLATLWPAWRAARLDPVEALRHE